MKRFIVFEIIIFMFLLGTVVGIYAMKTTKESELNRAYIELDSEKEKSYQLELENQKLNTILNNYTIEERKID